MKPKYLLLLSAILIYNMVIAQPPDLIRYQGIARDTTGNPVSNDTISLRISVRQATAAGTVIYKETHNPITNEFGSFGINIGGGTLVTGNFSTIPWGRNNYFQEVEMDITGGTSFVSMGTSQYLSVPYALATDSARYGIAPFFVQNTLNGNDTTSVGIVAIANGNAPTIFALNSGNGNTIVAESDSSNSTLKARNTGTGNAIDAESGGNLATLRVLNTGTGRSADFTGGIQVNTGNLGISLGDLSVGGSGQVNGNLNVSGNEQVFGTLTVSSSGQVNGNLTLFGNLIMVSGNAAVQSLNVGGNGSISGNLNVAGTLSKGAGTFKIDHPLDPANKYLYHSFVESPDMKNIYDGNIVTDAKGEAIVELPAYFEALNRDFRYQLTPIGQFAQAIILQEIKNNEFHIKTDKPNIKISWQVTGIRKDAFAEKNRIIPEVEKEGNEKGKYLYPASFK